MIEGLGKEIETILYKEERQRYLSELQTRKQEEGIVPHTPSFLLYTFRYLLEYIGGACLGCFVGAFTLLVNFIIFVYVLHLEF